MPSEDNEIRINGMTIMVNSLLDLHSHWPELKARLNAAIDNGEIADKEVHKIIRWLSILGDKTLYRID